ncbi:MAG: MaoC family dehydratase [Butyrivibrio sp.]|nr:MaoC family dehydratase [Butyrivibrio sp.]
MNCFSYEDLFVGQIAEFSREITADMMDSFSNISGDVNPLHKDDKFAQEKGYPDRVVYGMLTASMYSCLGGVYIPGKNCLLQSVHADFLSPVFIGDILTCTGKIVEKNDSVRQVVIKSVIRNQNGKKVSRARIEAGVL